MKRTQSPREEAKSSLDLLLRALKLPSFVRYHAEVAERAEKEGWGFEAYLHHLAELELDERKRRRVDRIRDKSGLPPGKTLATLDTARLPAAIRRQLPTLAEGAFARSGDNVLAFGLPGRGKTHVLCAIGHELCQRGLKVLFLPAFALVQRLLVAKKALALEKELERLDVFDAVIIDDIGYIQQDREEMEVLFTFLAARYERRSVMISSNLVFSQWDRIFKDPLTTAAAIDRIVHHAIILELTGASYRSEAAKTRNEAAGSTVAAPDDA